MEKEKWEQGAVKHPGRVHRYLMREYGKEAFHEDGTIKEEYLNRAEERAKKEGNIGLEKAIVLAKTFKKQNE